MSRYSNPTPQLIDGNGKPVVGAKKFFFSVDTEIKKTVYSDSTFGTAIANPVLSNADGRFPEIFLDGLYDEVQQDDSGTATGYDGATLWGPIPVGEVAEGPLLIWASDNSYDVPDIVLGSDDNYYKSLIDSNSGNNPVSSPGSWEQLQFGRVWNVNITYDKGDTVYASDGFLYISIIASNVGNNPVSDSTSWRPATNQNQSAVAAGTVDAITAVFPIPFTTLNDQTVVTVRASGANTSTTPTFAPDGLTAKTIVKNGNQALLAGDIRALGHELILKYNLTNSNWELLNATGGYPSGSVVQKVTSVTTAYATGTTTMPLDDTIPQNTEGTEFLTASITPKYSDSSLHIEFSGNANSGTVVSVGTALFQDSTADALAATIFTSSAAGETMPVHLLYEMTSGTTSATTFKIRMGTATASTVSVNGLGSRLFGGVMQTRMTITEVRV